MTSAVGSVDVDVIPRLYGASELGVLSLTAPGEAHPRVLYVGGELFVGLDRTGTARAAVTEGEAERWARPFRDVAVSAVQGAGELPAPDAGVVVIADEILASAVLLDPSRLAGAVPGAPVVFALARDRVAIVGEGDEGGVARVLDLAEELYEAGGPLVSIHPVTVRDGEWAPFDWFGRFPGLEMRIHRAIRLFGVRAYEAQTVALQRPDVHVADPKVHVREDGVTITYAAWPQGTATLLPVVDNVMIADPSGKINLATMNDFLDAAGDAVARTGLSPARYFIPGDAPR